MTSEATEKNLPEFLKWMQLFFPDDTFFLRTAGRRRTILNNLLHKSLTPPPQRLLRVAKTKEMLRDVVKAGIKLQWK